MTHLECLESWREGGRQVTNKLMCFFKMLIQFIPDDFQFLYEKRIHLWTSVATVWFEQGIGGET